MTREEDRAIASVVQMLPLAMPMAILEQEGDQLSCFTGCPVTTSSKSSNFGVLKHWRSPFCRTILIACSQDTYIHHAINIETPV